MRGSGRNGLGNGGWGEQVGGWEMGMGEGGNGLGDGGSAFSKRAMLKKEASARKTHQRNNGDFYWISVCKIPCLPTNSGFLSICVW